MFTKLLCVNIVPYRKYRRLVGWKSGNNDRQVGDITRRSPTAERDVVFQLFISYSTSEPRCTVLTDMATFLSDIGAEREETGIKFACRVYEIMSMNSSFVGLNYFCCAVSFPWCTCANLWTPDTQWHKVNATSERTWSGPDRGDLRAQFFLLQEYVFIWEVKLKLRLKFPDVVDEWFADKQPTGRRLNSSGRWQITPRSTYIIIIIIIL